MWARGTTDTGSGVIGSSTWQREWSDPIELPHERGIPEDAVESW
ncbi:hypothetical protein DB30_00113 [Enhygromyxa salina]|uniref:Uncharacterized protein n=1 Tax=Enhygromyxa salina TaxID=215803 RepID=A0A0C1ZPP4_9BACT|nr:hypothetical protein DB30_00113 [Enhygromyxa salina]